ncbi:MAG: cell division FtsZ family protein [Muribaculaceae bacterium]|nr:cell division FtsZ family protein [Muribaculaceae bacterium]
MNPEDPNLLERYHNRPDSRAHTPTIIAMGVGGGGCNAIGYMLRQGVTGVDFVMLNTDNQSLESLPDATKVLLGPNLCKGQGAGGSPEIGEEAAKESIPEIEKLLTGRVEMVFVTAGMGGGTGTGGAPIVASVAKNKEILTVGIVTIPFFFEGMRKIKSALDGAARLQKNVDALLVINNDRLSAIYPDMEWSESFTKADDILTRSARTISDMVTNVSIVNIDMRDVDSCLRKGRTALISVGYGEGKPIERMQQAIQNTLYSPLLCDTDIRSAKSLLFAFYYSHNINPPFNAQETSAVNQFVAEFNPNVKIKFGWGFDDSLDNKIKFTLLASGFDVSVKTGDIDVTIAGSQSDDEETNNDARVIQAYGKEMVEEFNRQQETQNYFVLNGDELDDDRMIEMVAHSPAFKRDKRKINASMNRTTLLSAPEEKGENKPKATGANQIFFSEDDR